jgi:hypothetical protein
MHYEDHTILKAGIENLHYQLQIIISNSNSKTTAISDEMIHILSYSDSLNRHILYLSRQYPNEVFEVKYSDSEPDENLVTTYHYQNGESFFVRQEYEYCFGINTDDLNRIPKDLYNKFKEMVIEYFSKADNYRIRISEKDPGFQEMPVNQFNKDKDCFLVPSVELCEGNIKINAKKSGLTYLDVTVEIREKDEKNDNLGAGDYDPLPF